MKALLLTLFVLYNSLFASKMQHFIEQRYIYALDKNITLKGSIRFEKERTTIHYIKPQERTIEVDDKAMRIYENNQLIETKNLENEAKTAMYIHFITLLYKMDLKELEGYFYITKSAQRLLLKPTPLVADIITSIEITLTDNRPKTVHTTMSSGDAITLEIQ